MNRQFAALNGLAIVIVVLFHAIHFGRLSIAGAGYQEAVGISRWVLLFFSEFGIFAVPTFLFTSGAFVAYAARRTPPNLPWKSVRAALERVLRPYVIWSFVFYIVIYFQRDEVYSVLGYVKNLIVGYPYNFVPLLIFYYLVSPILVRLAPRFGAIVLLGIALYQLLLIAIQAPGVVGVTLPETLNILVPPALGTTLALWAIFFPLGLVYSLNSQRFLPWLQKLKWPLLATTLLLFAASLFTSAGIIRLPIAGLVAPLTLALLLPLVKRKSIPKVRQLEKVSKRSYGLYLTHLIVLDLTVLFINAVLPELNAYPLLLVAILLAVGLSIPLLVMSGLARIHTRRPVYRYVFG